MENIDSARKSTKNNEFQSPTKLQQQNNSEVMNSQMSPDKDKKPEKTKAEAVFKHLLLSYKI
jgi:hypothetical protein